MPTGPTATLRLNSEALPHHTLTTPPLAQLPLMTEAMERRYRLNYIDLRVTAGVMSFDEAAAKADAFLSAERPYLPYSRRFNEAACSDRSLTGLMLWLCLRREHRAVTLPRAEELLIEYEADYWRVRDAVLDLFGYGVLKNADAVAGPDSPPATAST